MFSCRPTEAAVAAPLDPLDTMPKEYQLSQGETTPEGLTPGTGGLTPNLGGVTPNTPDCSWPRSFPGSGEYSDEGYVVLPEEKEGVPGSTDQQPGVEAAVAAQPASGSTDQQEMPGVEAAVAAPPAGPQPDAFYDVDVFLNYGSRFVFTGHWRQHNEALKYFRDAYENPYDPQHSVPFPFEDTPATVAKVVHDEKGPGYSFNLDEENKWMWSWQEMVAQMTDAAIKRVVQGEGDDTICRSRGIVRCALETRPVS